MELSWWKKFLFSLLPSSTVFSSIKDRFFTILVESFGVVAKMIHDRNGQNLTDVFPDETTRADDWSDQFGSPTTLTVAKLKARWAESGGQSPNYLQSELHAAGLTTLFVHEWWVPGSDPVTARNPLIYINDYQPNNLLVNPVLSLYEDLPQCGELYQCGDDLQCGDSEGLKYEEKIYPHPDVAAQYPYYFYVCAETFGVSVEITDEELQEAKRIIYKIKPMEQRCVLYVNSSIWVNDPLTGLEVWVNEPTTGLEVYVNVGDR